MAAARATRAGTKALAVASMLAFFACNIYTEALLLDGDDAGAEGGRGRGFWSGEAENGCTTAGRPQLNQRPSARGNADIGPVVLALRTIDLGTGDGSQEAGVVPDDWKHMGFDIDGLCTGVSDTCRKNDGPSCAPLRGEVSVDGDHCSDNSFGNLSASLAYASSLTAEFGFGAFDCALCAGHFNYLVRITGYNGEPNDDQVEVDFFPSAGLEAPLPLECRGGALPDSACFRSYMPWKVDRSVLEGVTPADSRSRDRATTAFVRDGVIVVFMQSPTRLYFPGDHSLIRPFPLRVHRGFMTGKLAKGEDGTWRVDDGMIGGSTLISDLFESMQGIGLCPGSSNYSIAQGMIENVADVLSNGSNNPTTPCDAISVGLGFSARQATLGSAVDAPLPNYCAP